MRDNKTWSKSVIKTTLLVNSKKILNSHIFLSEW